MPPTIALRKVEEVSREFDKFCSWLIDVGISYEESRIQAYQDTLKRITKEVETAAAKSGGIPLQGDPC